jgi:eukaryotic-like serine/threonine-protein kinase
MAMEEPTISLPQVFGGRYERGPMLGRGGMAAVFRARDRRLGRDVALKLALPPAGADAAARARMAREAHALAELDDPRVVRVLDVGEEAGIPYLVMELIEGTTLAERLREGPLAPEEAARIGAEVAGGLAAVHARGLVHRDVKPDNVLLGPGGRVRLVDFGIARGEGPEAATTPGIVVGTPGFIAPEVLEGATPDARADCYALGLTLRRALAAGAPDGGPPPPRAFAALLEGLVARDPAARPTAGAAEHRLRALLEPVAPTLAMPAAPRRRTRALAGLAVAAAAALALAIGLAQSGGDPGGAPGPTTPATTATAPASAATVPATSEVVATIATEGAAAPGRSKADKPGKKREDRGDRGRRDRGDEGDD